MQLILPQNTQMSPLLRSAMGRPMDGLTNTATRQNYTAHIQLNQQEEMERRDRQKLMGQQKSWWGSHKAKQAEKERLQKTGFFGFLVSWFFWFVACAFAREAVMVIKPLLLQCHSQSVYSTTGLFIHETILEKATLLLALYIRSHHSHRSLCSVALQRSAALCSALQRSASLHSLRLFAPFTGSLTCFAHSLVGQWKFLSMCSRCYRISRVHTRFSFSLETRPYQEKKKAKMRNFSLFFWVRFQGPPCRAPKSSVMDFPCIFR